MLGKRPRPLQRSTSKLHVLSNDSAVSSIAENNLYHENYERSKPFVEVRRQVIGFNPANEEPNAIQSTLPGIRIQCSETRSSRSLRSGLESLLSNPPACEKKAREGITMEIDSITNGGRDVPKLPTSVISKPLVIDQQRQCCVKQSEPICISLTCSKQDTLGRRHWDEDDSLKQSDDYVFRGLRSYTTRKEAEMETRESIFSTASPVSYCGEIDCSVSLNVDFLTGCYLCKRQLGLGKDIYMYRGDRAFCSVECRYQHIAFEECKVRCSASVPASSLSRYPPRLFPTSPARAV